MLKKIIYIAGFLLLAGFPVPASAIIYSSVIDDLPLMHGMTEKPDDTLVFDKPGGRIVEVSAETPASEEEVRDFYAQVLPPLGWKSPKPFEYVRENEMLKMEFEKAGGETLVHFTLTPNSEGK